MDSAFLNAARPPVHLCLGRRLEPLTIGHLFLLAKYAPAFLEEKATSLQLFSQLIPAVFVCSHPQDKAERIIKRWTAPHKAAWWALKFRFHVELRRWALRKMDLTLPVAVMDEVQRFDGYLRDSMTPPAANTKPSLSAPLNSPIHWILVGALMSETRLDLLAVKYWTVVEAQCFLASVAERRGELELMSSEHMDAIREIIASRRSQEVKHGA